MLRRAPAVIFWLLLSSTLFSAGQIPSRANKPASGVTNTSPILDPLGRSTPRGTITGFIRAAHRKDFVTAAKYMQLTNKEKTNTEVLVRDLEELFDRYFSQPITTISDSPNGLLDDGLPFDQEKVALTMGGKNAEILLVRAEDPQSGPIWQISSQTLSQVPALYGAIQKTWVEREMPESLQNHDLFGTSLALWLAWLASISIPLLILWLLSSLSISLVKRTLEDSPRRKRIESWSARLRWPAILSVALIVHLVLVVPLGFSLAFRIIYNRVVLVFLVLTLSWLILRISSLFLENVRSFTERKRQTNTESLILLGQRIFKVVIVLAAILSILTIVGIDTKTALAGLGIGGVAVALGAQKSVENLLGGIFLLSDKAVAVGDMCCISNRQGTIEDITLRSVRVRTLEQSLLLIPAGVLSQANIENFATRKKILVQTTLLLRYGTTVDQLQAILAKTHKLLVEDPKIETETARIRLVNFGPRAVELELYAYVLTPDTSAFLAVREALLLRIAAIVESSGSGFVQATEVVQIEYSADSVTPIRNIGSPGDSQSAKRPDLKFEIMTQKTG
jgi:MscS family membrane protein